MAVKRDSTILKEKKLVEVKKRSKNFNKVLGKTIVVSKAVEDLRKCVRSALPKNQSTKLLVDLLVDLSSNSEAIKKSVCSNEFVFNNIENINNLNLLKISNLNRGKKRKIG
jgi:hypothetical protein